MLIPARRGGETIASKDTFETEFLKHYVEFVEKNPRVAAALVALVYRDTDLLPTELFNNVSQHESLQLQLIDTEKRRTSKCAVDADDYNWFSAYDDKNRHKHRNNRDSIACEIELFVRKGGLEKLPEKSEYDLHKSTGVKREWLQVTLDASVERDISNKYSGINCSGGEGLFEVLKVLRIELEQKERTFDAKEEIPNLKPFPSI